MPSWERASKLPYMTSDPSIQNFLWIFCRLNRIITLDLWHVYFVCNWQAATPWEEVKPTVEVRALPCPDCQYPGNNFVKYQQLVELLAFYYWLCFTIPVNSSIKIWLICESQSLPYLYTAYMHILLNFSLKVPVTCLGNHETANWPCSVAKTGTNFNFKHW